MQCDAALDKQAPAPRGTISAIFRKSNIFDMNKSPLVSTTSAMKAPMLPPDASPRATAVDTSSLKAASHSTPSAQTSSQPTDKSTSGTDSKVNAKKTNSMLKAELSSVQARILELNETLHHLQHSLHQQQHPSGVGGKTMRVFAPRIGVLLLWFGCLYLRSGLSEVLLCGSGRNCSVTRNSGPAPSPVCSSDT